MPPKGWRKNAEGNYPQPSKEIEIVSIDDILFPKSTIQKLAKAILNDEDTSAANTNMSIAKDSLLAIQRAATVFVSHVLFHAKEASKEATRKTINTQDIFQALESAEFSGFIPEVRQKLSTYEASVSHKKKQKLESKSIERSPDPATKKLKSSDNTSVSIDNDNELGDEDDEVDEVDEVEDDDVADNDETEGKEETEELEDATDVNPIAASSKEEAEIEGIEEPQEVEVEDEVESGSDEE